MFVENTASGLDILLSIFELFPLLKVLLAVFAVYLVIRSVFTYRNAKAILTGQHFLEGKVVYQGQAADRRGRETISTGVKVDDKFLEFTYYSGHNALPDVATGDSIRIYIAPSYPKIKFLWIPSRTELKKLIFRRFVFSPLMVFLLAVIAFWMLPLMFFI